MEISCETCKYKDGLGCHIGWCVDREFYERGIDHDPFIPSIHCIDREYHYWEGDQEFIEEGEMEI